MEGFLPQKIRSLTPKSEFGPLPSVSQTLECVPSHIALQKWLIWVVRVVGLQDLHRGELVASSFVSLLVRYDE